MAKVLALVTLAVVVVAALHFAGVHPVEFVKFFGSLVGLGMALNSKKDAFVADGAEKGQAAVLLLLVLLIVLVLVVFGGAAAFGISNGACLGCWHF